MEKQRELTEQEKRRVEKINGITAEYTEKGYTREDVTVPIAKANKIALLLFIPIVVIFGGGYILKNGFRFGSGMTITENILFLVLIIALTVAHELIHGLTWGILTPHHFKAIEFGIMKDSFTPYCTCTEALSKWAYVAGAFMPCLVLGIIPGVVSICIGSGMWLFLGVTMTAAGAGDLTNIWDILHYKAAPGDVILDHPSECGFIVLKK